MCKELDDAQKEILEYTRTGIFERRKTQYILLMFHYAVLGTCAGIALRSNGPGRNSAKLLILGVPLVMAFPLHLIFWYQATQIEKLDLKRRELIQESPDWQTWMGHVPFSLLMLTVVGGCCLLFKLLYEGAVPDPRAARWFWRLVWGIAPATLLLEVVGWFRFIRLKLKVPQTRKQGRKAF